MTGRLTVYLRALLRPLSDEEGQDLTEYGLLIGLIAIVCGVAVALFGDALADLWSRINEVLPFGSL